MSRNTFLGLTIISVFIISCGSPCPTFFELHGQGRLEVYVTTGDCTHEKLPDLELAKEGLFQRDLIIMTGNRCELTLKGLINNLQLINIRGSQIDQKLTKISPISHKMIIEKKE